MPKLECQFARRGMGALLAQKGRTLGLCILTEVFFERSYRRTFLQHLAILLVPKYYYNMVID